MNLIKINEQGRLHASVRKKLVNLIQHVGYPIELFNYKNHFLLGLKELLMFASEKSMYNILKLGSIRT